MRYIRIFIYFLVFSCSNNKNAPVVESYEHETQIDSDNSGAHVSLNDSIIWLIPASFTPISFLEAIEKGNNDDASINFITMLDEFPVDWVKRSDIEALMTLVKSTRKCKCFLNPYSSYIPKNDYAEFGGYAILFVNAYRNKSTISLGLYNCPKIDEEAANEIINWWNENKNATSF